MNAPPAKRMAFIIRDILESGFLTILPIRKRITPKIVSAIFFNLVLRKTKNHLRKFLLMLICDEPEQIYDKAVD